MTASKLEELNDGCAWVKQNTIYRAKKRKWMHSETLSIIWFELKVQKEK